MRRYDWAKMYCDILRHPLFAHRPDHDKVLVVGLILHAKEYFAEDGVIRGMDAAEMRTAFRIKAPVQKVEEAFQYLLKRGWVQFVDDEGSFTIKDFRQRQGRAGEFDDDGSRRPRQVYFIRAEGSGRIKIGCSANPWARLKALQTGSSEALKLAAMHAGGEEEERELHERFQHLRANREWFNAGPDLLSYIATVAATRSTTGSATKNPRVARPVATIDEATVANSVATEVAATTRGRSREEEEENDRSAVGGESEGRKSTGLESVDNPPAIPANVSESERSHFLKLWKDGKGSEATAYLAQLRRSQVPETIQRKRGAS